MAQEGKKISFSFSKSIKKPDLKPVVQETKKVDYIEYVDDKSIKVIGEEEKKDVPLVIPMLGSKSWHDRIINKINVDVYRTVAEENNTNKKSSNDSESNKVKKETVKAKKIEKSDEKQNNDSKLLLDELAAKELMHDLKGDGKEEENSTLTLSINGSSDLLGEQESTLENYEEIPIEKFGMALLRGMGWEPEKGIGKNSKVVPVVQPNLRPRGMGLGADKTILQKKNVQPKTKEEDELKLERGCYVRILAGKYNNYYGQLESFDDEAGRLVIKLALGNKHISLNENLLEPVTKDTYSKNSKVLNIATYEKFTNKTESTRTINTSSIGENSLKKEKSSKSKHSSRKKASGNRDSSPNEISSESDEKHKRKYDSNREDDSHKSKKSKKHRRHDDSELSRKNSRKDKSRERTRDRSRNHHSSSKSTDKKKHKKHKKSRSRSLDRR